jgi:hypothetical protein
MTLAVRPESTAPLTLPVELQGNQQIVQTLAWAQAAEAVYAVAEKLVHTKFVPRAYQGKPMEATAAILAGAELGLSQMASLRAFDDIQGTPAPKAITLRAVVQSRGHDIIVKESTAQVAVVTGRRRGDTEWQTSRWDIPRAQQMGLLGKDQWKSQPTAMLIARATSECCRLVAADAIMGMPYSAEELRDQDAEPEREAPRRVSLEELDAIDAQPAAPAALDAPTKATEPTPVVPLTSTQQKRMFALWRDLGYDGDENRTFRLEITSKILGLPEPLASSSDLTAEQAERVIAALVTKKAALDAENNHAAPQDGAE